MNRIEELMAAAKQRALDNKLPYAGALTPQEASELMGLHTAAKLVDVRTRAELDWVGRVPGAIEIELMGYPGNALNALFAHQIESIAAKDTVLLLLCRSGGRSNMAATHLSAQGYSQCYNVMGGFEGDKDANNQRNRTGGWRAAGLAWYQS